MACFCMTGSAFVNLIIYGLFVHNCVLVYAPDVDIVQCA